MDDFDENDTIIFEDFKLKFIKDTEPEEEEEEELQDEFVTQRNCDISSVFDAMKEHFIYTETKYFDKVTMSDFNDYFEDAMFEVSHGLEIDQDVPEFEQISRKIRKPTIHEWVGMNLENLKISYAYMRRLSSNYRLFNGSFYAFCQLGYETSTF